MANNTENSSSDGDEADTSTTERSKKMQSFIQALATIELGDDAVRLFHGRGGHYGVVNTYV